MTEDKTVQDIVYLLSCAVNDTVPEPDRIKAMDLPAVYDLAEHHKLTAAVAMTLEAAGYEDAQASGIVAEAVHRTAIFDAERTAVLQKLEEAGIWYMPLKGLVLKDLYPWYGMRQMADNDILFDASRAEDIRTVMEGLGFSYHDDGCDYHDSYFKPPVCCFEMHLALFAASQEQLEPYYRDVRKRLLKDENNAFSRHFSDEDFYIFMIAHEYNHYSGRGTGLRSLLDTYIYLKKKEDAMNRSYVSGELEKLGIAEFEKQNRSLALHLFSGETLTKADGEMLDFILSSGIYGTMENRVRSRVRKQIRKRGRAGYLLYKTFMPYEDMVTLYPVLEKAPFLLPFCWPLRIVKALRTKPATVLVMLKTIFKGG